MIKCYNMKQYLITILLIFTYVDCNWAQQYTGEKKNGVPHGEGIMIYPDGSTYKGEWKNGKRDGFGRITYPNGDQISGEWARDVFYLGRATLHFPDSSKYIGDYTDGMSGKGRKFFPSGKIYNGEFENNMFCGRGTMTWPDGQKYYGNWNKDKMQGWGIMTYADGSKLEAEWEDGKPHGNGMHIMQNGDRYDGEFVYGKKSGYGVYRWKDGQIYRGNWNDDKVEGKGTLYMKSGDIYEGYLKNGIFNGRGVYHWKNGDQYVGEWENGEQNGFGSYFYKDGRSYHGNWKNGKQHGDGYIKTKNGNRNYGIWEYGKKVKTIVHNELTTVHNHNYKNNYGYNSNSYKPHNISITNSRTGDVYMQNSCSICSGNGICYQCRGTGQFFMFSGYTYCPICHGSGKCLNCHGTGINVFSGNIHSNVANIDGQYVILNRDNSISNTNSSSSNNTTYGPKYVKKTFSCSSCKGTGTSFIKSPVPSYGESNKVYCEICDDYSSIHYHKPCEVCKGKSVVNRMVPNR